MYTSLSHSSISIMSDEGSPPSKRVKHDREDRKDELLQSLQAINVGVQQAAELVTIIQQHVHIDNNRLPTFIPGIHLLLSSFPSPFPFPFLIFLSFRSTCFALSLPHNSTIIPGDASLEALAEHVSNEVKRLNEQLQAIVNHIRDLQPHPRASDSHHVYLFFWLLFLLLFFFFFFSYFSSSFSIHF